MSMFDIYKRTQGQKTRGITFAAGLLIILIGGYWLSELLASTRSPYLQYFVPLAVVAGLGYLLFWIVNKPRMADFLIATEGEMKKVAWSSRKEVMGSTKVVIFTTFALAILLFVVDVIFRWFFQKIGVLQTG